MKKRTYITIWATVQTMVFIMPLIYAMWWTPYEINRDEHMVDTVNERAMKYEQPNGTITDFTLSEIMDNDAKLKYENRVWKLEHKELYWVENIAFTMLIGLMLQIFNIIWNGGKGRFD